VAKKTTCEELKQKVKKLEKEILELKREKEELQDSHEKYSALSDLKLNCIYIHDMAGKFIDANDAALSLLGYTRAEIPSINIASLIEENQLLTALETLEEIKQTGSQRIFSEYKLKKKDGQHVWVETDGSLILRNKEPYAVLAVARDFNNLLMAIQGNTSLMLFDSDPFSPFQEPLKNIEKQIDRGAKLTKQLLGYARKGKYNVRPINLNQIVEESSETFGRTRKEITIQTELEKDLYTVEADQGQVEQILYNLYVNAADAMAGGGMLVLKTSNVTHTEIKSEKYNPVPGKYIRLTVMDTGMGIDQRIKDHIFEPFFTTKELGRGTGLGLASVYGITKSHDGYIEVDSQTNAGTTFAVFLPASQKQVLDPAEATANIIEGSGTILLIDDEKTVLTVGGKVLKKMGYAVIKARGGKEAVDTFSQHKAKIDLVILDMIMPDMGGGDTYDRIKEIDPCVKVLLSSGYSIEGQAGEIMKRGCDGFIQKPFTATALYKKLKEIIAK
jgi:PAS domain S-box-containing protein